ncbi:4'-phosphopantetheinyl transferase family protein [Chitinimonas koreensis]|uniref:4'-phosphopantetheinyl transferase family protein n=1 Tax=Chitinimonas koreensis TaxID=356302 RepID=UPI0016548C81|nr:hypothetical protein [Chitinimonas koreensis]QNM99071.1 hypothetical protein H9L41_08165 [Chitinimonas koreensis]
MTGNSGGLTRDSRDVTRDDSSPAGCALLPLAPGELHLWYGFPAEMAGTDLASHYAALLSEDERARHGAFLFAEDAQRYLFTRALVRTVLSRYADVAPGDWVFSRNAHGKPAVAGPDRPGCAGCRSMFPMRLGWWSWRSGGIRASGSMSNRWIGRLALPSSGVC